MSSTTFTTVQGQAIVTTADVTKATSIVIDTIAATGHDGYTVGYMRYVENGYTCVFENDVWTTFKSATDVPDHTKKGKLLTITTSGGTVSGATVA